MSSVTYKFLGIAHGALCFLGEWMEKEERNKGMRDT